MFNIGPTELVVILVLALIVFGPKRLPEVGRTVGKSLREFRRASDEIRDGLNLAMDEPPTVGSMPPAEPTWESSSPQGPDPEVAPDPEIAADRTGPGAHADQRRPPEALRGAGPDSSDGHAQDPAGRPGEAGGGRVG